MTSRAEPGPAAACGGPGGERIVLPARPAARHRTARDGLYVPVDSPLHRLPAHGKVPAVLAFAVLIVLTPPGAWAAYAAYALLLAALVVVARLPVGLVLRRSVVELPFLVLAAVLPLVGGGPWLHLGGLELSEPGLLAGGTLAARATLAVVAAVLLASTTTAADLVGGLARLRVPRPVVEIATFMVRYAGILRDALLAQRHARRARGARPGARADVLAAAGGAGTLFLRSYERGERVQQAMAARGYGPGTPLVTGHRAPLARLAACALLPSAALVVLLSPLGAAG